MINLDQSIAKVKALVKEVAGTPFSRDDLIEAIMHEGAGRDRKTLLAWLNEQVDAVPDPLEQVPDKVEQEVTPKAPPVPPRMKPVYRPEKRGNVWCVLDTANNELRKESFESKTDARIFITRLELDVNGLIEERPFHFKRTA